MSARILPVQLVQEVEQYVEGELADADRYDNRELLDESGVCSLHQLASQIYARGWDDGERAQAERDNGQMRRDRARGPQPRAAELATIERVISAAQDVLTVTSANTERGQTRTNAELGALRELREALEAAGHTLLPAAD